MAADPCRYVIDTCAIMDLNGDNQNTSYTNDGSVREKIWRGLERLIYEERLWAAYAQKDEMERRCPGGHERLAPVHNQFYQADSPELLIVTMDVLVYADERARRRMSTRSPRREPADPYIAALAKLHGLEVVTNESH